MRVQGCNALQVQLLKTALYLHRYVLNERILHRIDVQLLASLGGKQVYGIATERSCNMLKHLYGRELLFCLDFGDIVRRSANSFC